MDTKLHNISQITKKNTKKIMVLDTILLALFLIIASFFRAIKEQAMHHNGGLLAQRFKNNEKWFKWFNGDGESWKISNDNIYLFSWWRIFSSVPVFISDSFHLSKTLEMSFIYAALAHTYATHYNLFNNWHISFWLAWIGFFIVGSFSMRTFYLSLNPKK